MICTAHTHHDHHHWVERVRVGNCGDQWEWSHYSAIQPAPLLLHCIASWTRWRSVCYVLQCSLCYAAIVVSARARTRTSAVISHRQTWTYPAIYSALGLAHVHSSRWKTYQFRGSSSFPVWLVVPWSWENLLISRVQLVLMSLELRVSCP